MQTLIIAAVLSMASVSFGGIYKLDTSHTEVGFKVSHLVVSSVPGRFKEFDGTFKFDEKSKTIEDLKANIKLSSVDTSDAKRDEHLRSPDFFDTAKKENEMMVFTQTKKAVLAEKKTKEIKGDLTLKGVTKPVTLKVTYNGAVTDPWGNRKAGFEATTTIKRKDFNITWNKNLDGGGVVVGDEIKVTIQGEATAEAAKTTK